MESDMCCI